MDTYALELDVVLNEDAGETAEGVGQRLATHWPSTLREGLPPVTVEVVREAGPAGGWPLVRFTGTYLALALVAAAYVGVEATVGELTATLLQARLVEPAATSEEG